MTLLGKNLDQWLFTSTDQIAFLEQWLNYMDFGLSTRQFCDALIASGTEATKAIGQAGRDAPAEGGTFIGALTGWFPEIILTAIQVASDSGDIKVGIGAAIKQLQGGQQIIWQLTKVLAFPFCITIGVGGLGVYVAGKVLDASREPAGMGLIVRETVMTWGLPLAVLCVLLLIAISISLPRWSGKGRQACDGLPLFSLYKVASAATLLDTLSNLLACGMKLDGALAAIEENSTPFIKGHVAQMRAQKTGELNLGNVLDTQLLLPAQLVPLKMLGDIGNFTVLLNKSAVAHHTYTTRRLTRMKNVLPMIGILIAILLLATLVGAAVYQLFSAI
ncbi:hypothetical protein [Photobacterium indicum]|uniref:hypothetical protein n=1 Tax=Photobacterium indicum TaxID=81447 RepID=UPI003D0C6A0A